MGESLTDKDKELFQARWARLSISEQMANIGSEVGRALNWRNKGNEDQSRKAVIRALDLLDLSLDTVRPFSRLKEFARLREALVDYFFESNQFASSEKLWRSYFDHFNYFARRNR